MQGKAIQNDMIKSNAVSPLPGQAVQAYVDSAQKGAITEFSDILQKFLTDELAKGYDCIVVLCIGTDRSTGDSLGPLVGYKLATLKLSWVYCYGTLENPVHAKNLEQTIEMICRQHENPLILAIDACLGTPDHIGWLTVGRGPVKPGSGVNKQLAPVGNLHITGIVNFSGFMDFITLQNTRLALVMKMADIINISLRYVLWKLDRSKQNVAAAGES